MTVARCQRHHKLNGLIFYQKLQEDKGEKREREKKEKEAKLAMF